MITKSLLYAFLTSAVLAAAPEQEVRAVLEKQKDDWNRGDVRAYMQGYAPDTIFVSSEVARGSGPVLERYLKKYPNREAMGTLTFSEIEIRLLGTEHASVIGRWALTRSAAGGGNTGGRFTLLLRKTAAGWKVMLDHTS